MSLLVAILAVTLIILLSPLQEGFGLFGIALYTVPALVLTQIFSNKQGVSYVWLVAFGLSLAPLAVLVARLLTVDIPLSTLGSTVAAVLVAVLGATPDDLPLAAAISATLSGGLYYLAGLPLNGLISYEVAEVVAPAAPRQCCELTAPLKLTALEAVLAAHKLEGAREDGHVVGPVVTRRFVRLPAGRSFTASLTDLARDLGYEKVGLVRNAKPGCMALDIPTEPRQTFTLTDVLTKANWPRGAKGKLPVCFAVDVEGKPYTDDLATWVQVIVAGTTGAGKSVAMNAIILSLMAAGTKFDLLIADGKGDDFAPFYEQSKHLLKLPTAPSIACTPEEIEAQLEALIGIMDDRANDHSIVRTPIIYLVDELLDVLMAGGKKLRVELENKLVRLAQKGRSFGILLLTATQTPSSAALPEPFRANVPTRLGMTTEKAKQSAIIIGESGCEQLLERGDALLKRGSSIKRIHCANITQADFDRYMR